MAEKIRFRLADNKDLGDIKSLLQRSELPAADFDDAKINFVVATNENNDLVGSIGLEQYGAHGLLRSLAVEKNYRNNRTGKELLSRLLSLGKQLGVNELHLLTTTAEKFFLAAGFNVLPRNDAPLSIKATSEFTSVCPSTSTYMVLKDVQTLAFAYRKDTQVFHKDKESGSDYWAIKGENLLFTYFEVPADTRFAEHSHASEQITYVLEGELFFEIEKKMYTLTPGDTIMIPGNKKHRVWTKDKHTRTIDAWSPVNEKYTEA